MSARNLVRYLRDSGTLATLSPRPRFRSTLVLFVMALCFGAVMYLGATSGVPVLLQAVEKKPPALTFSKP